MAKNRKTHSIVSMGGWFVSHVQYTFWSTFALFRSQKIDQQNEQYN
jgi:hypothetical protein